MKRFGNIPGNAILFTLHVDGLDSCIPRDFRLKILKNGLESSGMKFFQAEKLLKISLF